MKKINYWSVFAISLCIIGSLQAQYSYSVGTLIPRQSNLVDDGLCLDEKGNLYGSYWGIWQGAAGRHVLRYRTNGTYDTLAVGMNRPNGMAYRDGHIYVANSGTSEVFKIDTNGVRQLVATVPGATGVAVVPQHPDSLVVSSWSRNSIYGVGPSGTSLISNSSLLNGPAGITYDPAGNLYVGNYNNNRVLRYDGNGTFSVFATITGAVSFLTYSDSTLIVPDHQSRQVHIVPLDGGATVSIGSGAAATVDGIDQQAAFDNPNGVAATPSGDTIYISEFGGKALRMIVRIPAGLSTTAVETAPFKVHYNATAQCIHVTHSLGAQPLEVRLFDLTGKLCLQQPLVQDTVQVDAQAGVYLIQITHKEQVVHHQKVLISQ